ncbi:hypothetical protein I316_07748 [Kwoniella heveanensis BCC8398]|uniref:Uncharacterized protein n=1 Tax=Kwoniella heveanensis BCC8398 TaxID=1296120 RepID=A0A1B9GHT9_9TREE|nr:hypothetical protein I316_07748 [Kwoniella heveanensis BCC8398]
MPGYDESLAIPPHLEPPRLDADETLPSMLHPSYPFGRPVSLGKKAGSGSRGRGVGNLLGTVGEGGDPRNGWGYGMGTGVGWGGGGDARGERWHEWGLEDVVEREKRKEVPPGMAGAKRPPSPPSPALRPSHLPLPRSQHLRHLLERQQLSPQPPNDGFDAPVPNETYEEDHDPQQQRQQQQQQQQPQRERTPVRTTADQADVGRQMQMQVQGNLSGGMNRYAGRGEEGENDELRESDEEQLSEEDDDF